MKPRRGRALTVAFAGGLVLATRLAEAVEVAVLRVAAPRSWRAVVDALEEGAPAHRVTKYELATDRAQAQQTVAGLRGHAAVLVALGPAATEAARAGLPDVPLVFCMVPDPAGLGLALAPAPHVAGVAFEVPVRNQLAALRMVNPRAVRLGVLYTVEHTARYAKEAESAAPVLRLAITSRAVESAREVPAALRALLTGADAVDALWLPPDPVLLAAETRRSLLAETLAAGKAVYAQSSDLVAEGALASHGPDLASIGQQAAALVDRLAAGERDIPLRAPRAELLVNLRTAERLGVEIPETVLDTAKSIKGERP